MSFWSVLLAVAWDRVSPLSRPSQADRLLGRYADWIGVRFNAGTRLHGRLAWAAAVLPPAFGAVIVGDWLGATAHWLGFVWSVAVLYFCLGFRSAVEMAQSLAEALRREDDHRARERLRDWGLSSDAGAPALAGVAMGEVFRRALVQLFGAIFWFALLGVFGAVVYALTRLVATRWRGDSDFHLAVEHAAAVLDWLPIRVLAVSFALVGDFEHAVAGWRTAAERASAPDDQALLAAAFGALGLPPGEDTPAVEYLVGAIGLVTRALLLWLAILGLFWLAGL